MEKALETTTKVHHILARLPLQCDETEVKNALESEGIILALSTVERPVTIQVKTQSRILHKHGTHISVIVRTPFKVPTRLKTNIREEDACVMYRPNGVELFPVILPEKNVLYPSRETNEIVICGWKPNAPITFSNPVPDNGYQAGAQFFGKYIPGTEPQNPAMIFYQSFPETPQGDADLLEATRIFLQTPTDQHIALSF
jgi:hypothetical protein